MPSALAEHLRMKYWAKAQHWVQLHLHGLKPIAIVTSNSWLCNVLKRT